MVVVMVMIECHSTQLEHLQDDKGTVINNNNDDDDDVDVMVMMVMIESQSTELEHDKSTKVQ